MLHEEGVASEVQALLSEKLFVTVESHETDLLATGILDSLTLVQLLMHLEERFGLRVAVEDLEIEDLRSIHAIARLVTRQKRACAAVSMHSVGAD
ncbi:MAG TPA: acyl carrier protein [Terriglobia bacterium]|nr:acyl carrier protein [Terriglobia bacterium]